MEEGGVVAAVGEKLVEDEGVLTLAVEGVEYAVQHLAADAEIVLVADVFEQVYLGVFVESLVGLVEWTSFDVFDAD